MSSSTASRSVAIALLAGAFVGLPHAARAQVYKCPQPGGGTSFQGTPCPTNAKPPAPPKAGTVTERPSGGGGSAFDSGAGHWTIPDAPPQPQARPDAVASQRAATPAPGRVNPHDPQLAENQRIQAENQRIEAENRVTEAANKQSRCNAARNNLAVLKGGHAVYRADNNGDRHYVDDANRQAEINAAQQQVNSACN